MYNYPVMKKALLIFFIAMLAAASAARAGRAETEYELLHATVTVPFGVIEKWGPPDAHELNAARALKLAHAYETNRDPRYASATLDIFLAYSDAYKPFCDSFHKGRMTGCIFEQLLDEANWITDMAEAYDAVARAGAVSADARDKIYAGLFGPAAGPIGGP